MKPVVERFAKNLREELQRSSCSREELAARAELHPRQLSGLARGEHVPYLDTAIKLASALGVGVERLVEGIVWNPVAGPGGGFEVTQDNGKR